MAEIDRYAPHALVWNSERAARLWDFYGSLPGADALYFSVHSGGALLDYLEARLPLAGLRVLDFGCGRGVLLARLVAHGVRCAGLDFSAGTVEGVAQRLAGGKTFEGVVRATTVPTPVAEGSFDVVLLVEVVEHLLPEQLNPTLTEVHRILRPGGHVFATVPHAEDIGSALCHCPECGATFHRWQHLRSLDATGLEGMMRSAGFETVVCEPACFLPNTTNWKGRLASRLSRFLQRLRGRRPALPHLLYLGRKPKDGQ